MADDEYSIDNYQLVNCVATGNFTQVWEAVSKGGSNRVAMKLMLKEAFGDAEQRSVFKHEMKVAKSLEHPGVIRCQETVFNKKHAYMIMDYFPALNLKSQIGGSISELQMRLRKIIEQICQALGYMHEQGWVHRDIKPDNILCNKSSEVRLIDFSLCSRYGRGITKAFVGKQKIIQGTRTYIAPETVMKQSVSPQTDIYSLGITIFEGATGVPPFFGSSPGDLLVKHVRNTPPLASDLNPNVAPEMDLLVAKMLKKKPKDRQQSVAELAAEIRNVKMFKVDPKELSDQQRKAMEAKQLESLDKASRLDSRNDALRSELRSKDPKAVKSTKPAPPPAAAPASGKGAGDAEQKPKTPPAPQTVAAAQPPTQPAPPPIPNYPQPPMGYPQMAPPGYPPQYYPPAGYPQPQYPQQPYPMPQYQPQQGYPPQQYPPGVPYPYPPGAPQYPQGAVPGYQQPPYPAPPGAPPMHGAPPIPAQQPPARVQQQPQLRAPQQPPAARSAPAAADIPLMDELPPIKTEKKPKQDIPLMNDLPPVV